MPILSQTLRLRCAHGITSEMWMSESYSAASVPMPFRSTRSSSLAAGPLGFSRDGGRQRRAHSSRVAGLEEESSCSCQRYRSNWRDLLKQVVAVTELCGKGKKKSNIIQTVTPLPSTAI